MLLYIDCLCKNTQTLPIPGTMAFALESLAVHDQGDVEIKSDKERKVSKMAEPLKKFSAGAISVAIWSNISKLNGQEATYNTISLDRRYKDKEGRWQSTNQFRINDLPKAAVVLSKAYEYLVLKTYEKSVESA